MQRVIKFRAWDKENQRIIKARPYESSIVTSEQQDLYTSAAGSTDSTQLVISLKGVVGDVWPGPESYGLVSNVDFDVQDYILLQYTGLKDKNDVEIYEGDIVRIKNNHGYFIKKSVAWNNGNRWQGFRVGKGDREIEVIGNIYENPELLEAEL